MILELFAGYGGLGMAVSALTGARVGYVSEVDEAASKVLALRYQDAQNLGDVTQINWPELVGKVHIITAGFPCQGISNAGLRKGLEDERSGLWSYVVDSVRVIRPRYAFLENVAALTSRGLPVIAADLANIGYDLRWTCVRASEESVGLAHHRNRWFGIAIPAVPDPDRP